MANQNQPSRTDRIIAHAVVGVGVGALVGKRTGLWGFIVGAVVGVVVHEALDAPAAQVVADISQWLKTI